MPYRVNRFTLRFRQRIIVNTSHPSKLVCCLFGLALLMSASLASGAEPKAYRVTDIGKVSQIQGMNNLGEIVGAAGGAFVYTKGTLVNLHPLTGLDSIAMSINDLGQAVGLASDATENPPITYGFRYDSGTLNYVSYGPSIGDSGPLGINSSGRVVGTHGDYAFTDDGSTFTGLWHGIARAINNRGDIAGTYYTGDRGVYHACLQLSGGEMRDLGTLGGMSSNASSINNSGQLVGDSDTTTLRTHAFFFSGTNMTDLTPLIGAYAESHAYCINDWSEVTGVVIDAFSETSYPFLLSGGTLINLNKVILSVPVTLGTTYPQVNNAGQIACIGTYGNDPEPHGFLLTPDPSVTLPVAALRTDLNADRMMDFASPGTDLTTADAPHQVGLIDETQAKAAGVENRIQSIAALERFTLVNLKVPAAVAAVLSSPPQFGAVPSSVQFSIQGEGAVRIVGVSRADFTYLDDTAYGNAIVSSTVGTPLVYVSTAGTSSANIAGVTVDPITGEGRIGFLFEGVVDGDVALSGIVSDSNGRPVAQTETLYLRINNPVSLRADMNGDLKIDSADASSQKRPFRFWLNDDHDGVDPDGDPKGGDLDNTIDGIKDSDDLKITHLRDLEDFAMLNLKIPADVAAKLKKGSKLVFSITGTGSIHLVPVSRPGFDYLTDETYASTLIAPLGNIVPSIPMYPAAEGSDATISLDKLVDYSQKGDRTIGLLFEGVKEGDFALTGQIIDQTGAFVANTESFYVQLRTIKEMYDHFTVGNSEAPGFPVSQVPQPVFQHALGSSDPNTPYILFVHGWRLHPRERELFAETAFKRLYWAGYRGAFGLFSWPTEWVERGLAHVALDSANYDRSEYQAWSSGKGLGVLLNQLEIGSSPRVRIIAHSMGNIVASEALRDGNFNKRIHSYIATQAASVASAYDPTVAMDQFRRPDARLDVTLFPSADVYREWPTFNGLFFNIRAKIADGGIVSLCNPNDDALSFFKWEADQNSKPDTRLGYDFSITQGEYVKSALQGIGLPFNLQDDLDRYEAISFAIPATSLPLGAEPSVGGEVKKVIRLDDNPLWYSSDQWDHSAEFLSTIHRQLNYWRIVLGEMGIGTPPSFPPPPPIVGMYTSNIIPTDPNDFDHSGLMTLNLNRSLKVFSVSFNLGSKSYSSTGILSSAGHWEKTFTPTGAPTVVLKLDLVGGHLRGTVTTNGIESTLQGETVGVFSKESPNPNTGVYTALLSPGDAALGGTGYARLVVASTGSTVIVGVLPDGTPFSSAGRIQEGNSVTVKALPYGITGGILGKLHFSDEAGISDADGAWTWRRPPSAKATLFPLGVSSSINVVASRFSPKLPLLQVDTSLLTQASGNLTLTCASGGLLPDIARPVWLNSLNKVVPAGPAGTALSAALSAKTGLFSGTFTYPPTGKAIAFAGALFQKQQIGGGLFKTATSVGSVGIEVTHPSP